MRSRNFGPLFIVLSAMLWSLCGIFTKAVQWDPVSVCTVRGIVALPVIAAVCRPFPLRLNRTRVLSAVCYFTQGMLFIMANRYTTAANATVLQYTSPIYILILTALVKRKLPRRKDIVTCLILFAGIAMAFCGNLSGGGMLGNVLALASGLFYAGVFYCSGQPDADAVTSLLLGNALYLLLLPWVLLSPAVRGAPLRDLGVVLLFGLIVGAVAWLCFARGVRTTPPLQANFIAMLEPVLAPMWTFLFLGEKMTFLSLVGCAVVIVTLMVSQAMDARNAVPS